MKTALSIAGSDCSGGAGIQADLKTMTMNGVYAMCALTALTAQNTTGVSDIMEVTPAFLKAQLDMVFTDIRPDAVKRLSYYQAENLVVDPVMVATSGSRLMESEAAAALKQCLLPLAVLVTPNIPEAEVLSGMPVRTLEDMTAAALRIEEACGCGVLLKGGHGAHPAEDLLCVRGTLKWLRGKYVDNPNTHGTGCTLSSAIAANLAKGCDLETAVRKAKDYLSGALGAMLDLGRGSGPMNHAFALTGAFAEL